ncbi:MAG: STM3941 family protein [Pseudobdellovibrionaceae bacterium]
MNLQLRPRTPYPETALIVVRALAVIASLATSFYFFQHEQNLLLGFASLGGGFILLVLIGLAWPRPLPIVVMNDDGILDRRLNIGVIRWADIQDVQIEFEGKFICLRVQNPEAYVSKFPPVKREKMEFHQSLGFKMLNIEVKGLEVNVLQTVEAIREKIKQTRF